MRKCSSLSLIFSVPKQKRTKTKEARSTGSTPKKKKKHKNSKDKEMGEMGEAQIGLSNQASERGHRHGCNKNRLPRCDKKIHKEAIRVAPPSKTDPFNYTRILHTLNINKAIVTASFIICVQRERERERESHESEKKEEKETDTNTNTNTATERERERERYDIYFFFFCF